MHARDPSLPFQTVDNPFSTVNQPCHKFMALISNEAQDEQELTFRARDIIKIDYGTGNFTGYYRNGYRYGM